MIKNLFSSKEEDEKAQGENVSQDTQIDPDKLFLILFFKGSPTIYRTWVWKSDLEEFKKRLYGAEDTISLRKKFFQFGRKDEVDLTQIAGYQIRPYIIHQVEDAE